MLGYSKSFRGSIRSKTENLYDRARKKLTSSFRGADQHSRRRKSKQHAEHYLIAEDFNADSGGASGSEDTGQLSVRAGQRVEILDRFALAENQEFVAVAVVEEESGVAGQSRGYVPSKILLAVDPTSPSAQPASQIHIFKYAIAAAARATTAAAANTPFSLSDPQAHH
uniref:SH3 domain-containing protein n=1 Tax=Ditylenchus dipsaci TaxID=166011 RepID=A0A915CLH2_9BILA